MNNTNIQRYTFFFFLFIYPPPYNHSKYKHIYKYIISRNNEYRLKGCFDTRCYRKLPPGDLEGSLKCNPGNTHKIARKKKKPPFLSSFHYRVYSIFTIILNTSLSYAIQFVFFFGLMCL